MQKYVWLSTAVERSFKQQFRVLAAEQGLTQAAALREAVKMFIEQTKGEMSRELQHKNEKDHK